MIYINFRTVALFLVFLSAAAHYLPRSASSNNLLQNDLDKKLALQASSYFASDIHSNDHHKLELMGKRPLGKGIKPNPKSKKPMQRRPGPQGKRPSPPRRRPSPPGKRPSPQKGKPSPQKGKPSPPKGKPSPPKGKPS
uniref:Proline-rich protein HaeIII subfamily 1-like n=1 Tax=Strongyloides papillosus TaxID=174720 RepID=A0A0N5CBG3_STREA